MSLKAPRRKKRVKLIKQAPFPVSIHKITGEAASQTRWLFYTGYLHGQTVAVHHTGDMEFLYKMGFFGKGNLSRSQPEYNNSYKCAAISTADGKREIYPRVVNKQWYKQHLQWAEQISSEETSSEEDEEDNTQGEIDNFNNKASTSLNSDESTKLSDDSIDVNSENPIADSWGMMSQENKIKDSWDITGADNEFWSNTTEKTKLSDVADLWKTESEEQFLESEHIQIKNFTKLHEPNNKPEDVQSCVNPCTISNDKEEIIDIKNISDTTSKIVHTYLTDSCQISQEKDRLCSSPKKLKLEIDEITINKTQNNDEIDNYESIVQNTDWSRAVECKKDVNLSMFDTLCHKDDKNCDLFVIPNENFDKNSQRKKKKWKPVLKTDPFPVNEYLELSFVEKTLDLATMWKIFCEKQRNFIPIYITYHYFRSKGWVPKSGLKFGCDFILYKVGPSFYHGSYSVIVQYVEECSLKPVDGYEQRKLCWRSICGLNRTTEHVAKEVMMCYVIKPKNLTSEDLLSPSCISKFTIKEILLSRWISSQERQNKEPEEMP